MIDEDCYVHEEEIEIFMYLSLMTALVIVTIAQSCVKRILYKDITLPDERTSIAFHHKRVFAH